ncbi:hypothetical protein BC829DRAFT_439587 [Chytridium lagenaria]|nr:hypothetical protein BC829DRAFT_439587 [Chytridium lagenaria]
MPPKSSRNRSPRIKALTTPAVSAPAITHELPVDETWRFDILCEAAYQATLELDQDVEMKEGFFHDAWDGESTAHNETYVRFRKETISYNDVFYEDDGDQEVYPPLHQIWSQFLRFNPIDEYITPKKTGARRRDARNHRVEPYSHSRTARPGKSILKK